MTDPMGEQLRDRAATGTPRGAQAIWDAAQGSTNRFSRTRLVLTSAAILLLVLALGFVARRSSDNDQPVATEPPSNSAVPTNTDSADGLGDPVVSTDPASSAQPTGSTPKSVVELTGIEASGTWAGTTEVLLVFDLDLPTNEVRELAEVTDPLLSQVGYTTQDSADGDVSVCGSAHHFPSPGNRVVDVLMPSGWFAPDASLEDVSISFKEGTTPAKIITCDPRNSFVQVSIWGSASARPEDVTVVVEGTALMVTITPDYRDGPFVDENLPWLRPGGELPAGAARLLEIGTHCGLQFLGFFNDQVWITDEAPGIDDWLPTVWAETFATSRELLTAEVRLSEDGLTLAATVAGHAVSYRPVDDGDPSSECA